PKRGPHALSFGDADPRFEFSIFLREKFRRLQPRRCVFAGYAIRPREFFLPGLDHQIALLHARVRSPRGVVFQFVVSPAATASFHGPFLRVRRRSVGTVEFIAPGQHPLCVSALQWCPDRTAPASSRHKNPRSPAHARQQQSERPHRPKPSTNISKHHASSCCMYHEEILVSLFLSCEDRKSV